MLPLASTYPVITDVLNLRALCRLVYSGLLSVWEGQRGLKNGGLCEEGNLLYHLIRQGSTGNVPSVVLRNKALVWMYCKLILKSSRVVSRHCTGHCGFRL